MRLHASAGTGVKNPDFYELFGFIPAPAFVGNPGLKPERSFGCDAGIEWRPRDGVVFDVTYFHADLARRNLHRFLRVPQHRAQREREE